MRLAVALRDPDRVLLSPVAGEGLIGTALMIARTENLPQPLLTIHPNSNSLGDSSVETGLGVVDVAEVAILVSPSPTSINPTNDSYCLGPTPMYVSQCQLDQLNVQKVVPKTLDPISCQTVKVDVSYNVVSHVLSVPLHGPPQRKRLSPDQSVNKIKHVKDVCCVDPCHSAPSVTNVPNAVPEQNVGGRLQKFWQVWLDLGANPRVVSILEEG